VCVCLYSQIFVFSCACTHRCACAVRIVIRIRMHIVIHTLTLVQSGQTPLQVAELHGYESIATLIRNAGSFNVEAKQQQQPPTPRPPPRPVLTHADVC
jgi:hypothetical protein